MSQTTLAVASGITIVVGMAYGYVGLQLWNRDDASPTGVRATRLFALWWWTLGVNLVLGGVLYAFASAGQLTFGLQLADAVAQRGLLAVSLVGLLGYMSYVLSGDTRVWMIASIYAAYFVALMFLLVAQQPTDAIAYDWRTDLTYAHPPRLWSELASFVIIVVPPIVGSILYLRLLRTVTDRSRRYRIITVSTSLLVWWSIAVLAGQPQLVDNGLLQVAGRALSLGAAFAVLAAFHPPAWARRRWGIEAYARAA